MWYRSLWHSIYKAVLSISTNLSRKKSHVTLSDTILYHFISCHIIFSMLLQTETHITSHHITSHHITSHHITSHHIQYASYVRFSKFSISFKNLKVWFKNYHVTDINTDTFDITFTYKNVPVRCIDICSVFHEQPYYINITIESNQAGIMKGCLTALT